jgi:deoxyribonuclease V
MLEPVLQHPWDLSPQEAIALQAELARKVDARDYMSHYETVAGIDVGLPEGMAHASVVVLSLPELQVIEHAYAERPITFPYVPGLLSFREAPVILDALAQLKTRPDVLMVDGQGIAHPRRLGIAAHLGVILDYPAVGCAKSRLIGKYEEPGEEKGSYTWLRDGEEIIGAVLRTRTRVKPVFVSVGHKISLDSAIDLVLRCTGRYRLPEPTRWAHRLAANPILEKLK